ncbi:MAG: hypothetical protein N3E45_08730 [Oscillatoriaceae bacterium SKW80]|nr:hypothetical protein [Oscillatoriaceae bacterium SKYG93]MCX8120904.1 hypothetical protein [Oscillatoriaceae bacterium SKW80]MDW8452177.1 hypothetical protein [Oscillatoriaceae cyanobacterium SKYGB_i_bin93]HIK26514.1 hypothetical protein [Oscillatoriaceae cyanobacterium M7585_C2015_266]
MTPCSTDTWLGCKYCRLSTPLHGLMTIRYRGGSAFRWALHRVDLALLLHHHHHSVIKVHLLAGNLVSRPWLLAI